MGRHSVAFLPDVYAHAVDGQAELARHHIEQALRVSNDSTTGSQIVHSHPWTTSDGRTRPDIMKAALTSAKTGQGQFGVVGRLGLEPRTDGL